jgi:hypothetical protein
MWKGALHPQIPNSPMYWILNTAIGGSYPKTPPNDTTVFPAYHRIDYVRVAQKPGN